MLGMCACILSFLGPGAWYILSLAFDTTTLPFSSQNFILLITTLVMTLFGGVIGYNHDIVSRTAQQDSLTRLFNQAAFFLKAEFHFNMGTRYKDNLSIVMIDIDDFKQVNDRNNHLMGSSVLRDVAQIIRESLRETDIAARFGGDEFVLCLPRTDLKMSGLVAERIRSKIEQTVFHYKDTTTSITVSMGVATMKCTQGVSLQVLTERADIELYRAKKNGKNQVVLEGQVLEPSQTHQVS